MKKRIKLPLCFFCKYYWPNQGTGDGCTKTLHRGNPLKKTIYMTPRCDDIIENFKQCEYFERGY